MERLNQITSAPSITAIISGIAVDARELLIAELALTKLEFEREIGKAKAAAILIGVGVGLGFIGAIALGFMVAHLLDAFTVVPLWGCFGIVGGALVLFGALMMILGGRQSKNVTLVPRSAAAIRKDFTP